MEKQNHIFDELTVIFSQERLDGYLCHAHCNNSKNEALIAYSWNIELSQALYPALQVLEITLRNSLHRVITQNFQTEYWFDLSFLHEKEQTKIKKAKDTIKDKKKTLTSGRIFAELSFGFWVSLFDTRYEHDQTLWPKLIKDTFPFLAKGQRTRNFLSRELNRIKFLRNRVFHYEPIWHWKDLSQQHDSIIYLTNSLSPSAAKYLTLLDQFKEIYANGKLKTTSKLNDLLTDFK
jgi:hypothetical protein